jgi:hypothetical protein
VVCQFPTPCAVAFQERIAGIHYARQKALLYYELQVFAIILRQRLVNAALDVAGELPVWLLEAHRQISYILETQGEFHSW